MRPGSQDAFHEFANFGGETMFSNGEQEAFAVKYDKTGKHLWSHGYGGTSSDAGYGCANDAGIPLDVDPDSRNGNLDCRKGYRLSEFLR